MSKQDPFLVGQVKGYKIKMKGSAFVELTAELLFPISI